MHTVAAGCRKHRQSVVIGSIICKLRKKLWNLRVMNSKELRAGYNYVTLCEKR